MARYQSDQYGSYLTFTVPEYALKMLWEQYLSQRTGNN